MTATDRAMCTEAEDRIRELEAENTDLRTEITWLRNQMGDVRGMQSDGATPEEMDHALGRALGWSRARLAFDESRGATDEIHGGGPDGH